MGKFIHDKYTQTALDQVRKGRSFIITGKAGTGKTMLLRHIVETMGKTRSIAVCAPTGVAAKNAGGVTIHSLLGLPITIYIPGHKIPGGYRLSTEGQQILRSLDILIIDEVSMVRCDTMDLIDNVLRYYRKTAKPFGGLQVVMFGDLRQLMPVVPEKEWEELKKHYVSPYFFSSDIIKKNNLPMLELAKVHRQTNSTFISMLNEIRDGILSYENERVLRQKYRPSFSPPDSAHYIRLTTHKHRADRFNESMLNSIRGNEYEYTAYREGFFPNHELPCEWHLKLKRGARVMFIANDSEKQYVNGTLGTVEELDDESISVTTDDGKNVNVKKTMWDYYQYRINKENKEIERFKSATVYQYPLKLAWAITVHKSQGLTFSRVIIDAGRAFTHGQVYVALSRCRSLDGIVLVSTITPQIVSIDPIVTEYLQLVERIWPYGVITDVGKTGHPAAIASFIEKYNYKPIGHVFQGKWDGLFYDMWESAESHIYIDRLDDDNGIIKRLCVGSYNDRTNVFKILSNREIKRIKEINYIGGQTSYITIENGDVNHTYDFTGHRAKSRHNAVTARAIINREPKLRTYKFKRNDDEITITKSSRLSVTTPSVVKVYSDLGKLILCCDCFKILRNDSDFYYVAIDDGVYRVIQYKLNGKATTEHGRMVADMWYQKNKATANIKKTYEAAPEKNNKKKKTPSKVVLVRNTEKPVVIATITLRPKREEKVETETVEPVEKVKTTKQVKPAKKYKDIYKPWSNEIRILRCLERYNKLKAKDIAIVTRLQKSVVNSLLYGELSSKGFVEVKDYTWQLK